VSVPRLDNCNENDMSQDVVFSDERVILLVGCFVYFLACYGDIEKDPLKCAKKDITSPKSLRVTRVSIFQDPR